MSYLYLLDTNIISELIKNPRGVIFSKIQDVGEDKICTSNIVLVNQDLEQKKRTLKSS